MTDYFCVTYNVCGTGARRLWHIDHIRPLASFDLTDPKQQRQAFHYTNLQSLWAKENLSKGKKISCMSIGTWASVRVFRIWVRLRRPKLCKPYCMLVA
jgi:hypothetical protein